MNTIQTTPLPCRTAIAAATCLFALAIAGCGGRSSGQAHGPEDEHAGHVVPAHKPKNFPDAVRRLRELNHQIGREIAEGKARSLPDENTLKVALDIANWIPEIAADSDMPESPWNEVNSRSGVIVAVYQKILEGATAGTPPADALAALKGADDAISSLEKLLSTSDPRWFGKAKP